MTKTASLRILVALTVAASAALLTVSIAGAKRTPIRDCGDISMNVAAITAQGTTCTTARAIARAVPSSNTCTSRNFCQVRSYTCLLGVAGKELTLVRCGNSTETRFVRFEFGA